MSARSKLKRALNAIDDAQRALRRAKDNVQDDFEIRKAIRELDDAETDIKRALRDVTNETK